MLFGIHYLIFYFIFRLLTSLKIVRGLRIVSYKIIFLIPIVDKMLKVSLRLVAMDVDPQDVITRDNVSVKVNAVIYFRVIDPVKAIVEVETIATPCPSWLKLL